MRANEFITEGNKGLWANIHAKQDRIKHGSGEQMRKPGSKGGPSVQNFKDAATEAANPAQQAAIAINMKKHHKKPKNKGVSEDLNEFAFGGDAGEDPTDNYPCYDCGSTIFLHHTKLCELAEPNAKHDLPSKPGSQHWTGEIPKGLHTIPGLPKGLNEFAPNKPPTGGGGGPKDYGQPTSSRYIGGNKFVVGTTNNYVLTATIDKWGLEWDDDDEIWFLDSPGAAHIADATEGEIELPAPQEQRYQIHDLVTDYLNERNSAELQKVAAYYGHSDDGEMATNEGENWSKHNNKRVGGMSKKSVSSYRRSHPGSKIQTAVTTKPSKLKKGSKAAKRRKSFCARMKGMKKSRTSAKTARDPNSNINKSLRRWNCESIEEMQELVMIAEQKIRDLKK